MATLLQKAAAAVTAARGHKVPLLASGFLYDVVNFLLYGFLPRYEVGMLPEEMQAPVAAAVQLANLLTNGRRSDHTTPSSCSCALASAGSGTGGAVPLLSFSRAQEPLDAAVILGESQTQYYTVSIVRFLARYQDDCSRTPADVRMFVSKGGLLLALQHLALVSLFMPQLQPGARGRGSGRVPGCADVAAFLHGVDPAVLGPPVNVPAASSQTAHATFSVTAVKMLVNTLALTGTACSRCMPQQLLLVLDACTLRAEDALNSAAPQQAVFSELAGLLAANQEAWASWLTSMARKAVPTLSAWVRAAVGQLPAAAAASPPPLVFGARADSDVSAALLASAVLHAISMSVMLPGGVLKSPQLSCVPVEQLLAWAEQALRCRPNHLFPEGLQATSRILRVRPRGACWWRRPAATAGLRCLQCAGLSCLLLPWCKQHLVPG